ncbi:MAG: response regulator [Roseovarius sp.]|nr:response regulator [Roseovarius sp.]MCY4206617.1 response regulator [Roseovarius sp.]MCY4315271.1 response regulator [Roseovarius sp.]
MRNIRSVPPHLLVVDDDERLRGLLKRYLEQEGFLVAEAHDGASAMQILTGLEFDLIVMDVMMPGESGIEITRKLRNSIDTPILLLTAKGETENRIDGLEAGADDYLSKPFEPKELLLRINAILRRVPNVMPDLSADKMISLGQVQYDVERGELARGEQMIGLTDTEVNLMRILAASLREPVPRSRLFSDADGESEISNQQRTIDVQIARLRRKIEEDPRHPRYLKTVRGEGYMLVPD